MLSGAAGERLLGFDVRVPPADLCDAWTAERRAEFLLRDDVAAPLSTDVHVWPSAALSTGGVPALPGLHPELSALGGAGWTVAITRVGGQEEEVWWEPSPAVVAPTWELLGYDISDGALLSGLSNCGYGERRLELREAWAPYLNESHLFDDAARADGFRAISDARVREHAPFFVHGLYRVPAIPRVPEPEGTE